MPISAQTAAENLAMVRERNPLVHNITNFVVMNYTANALLALGASPVMAHAIDEVAQMVQLAGALVLNIGTLTTEWVDAMVKAARKANEVGVPVVLDPVGAGATAFRTASARRILDSAAIAVVRGNASEVLSLANEKSATRGVDAAHSVDEAAESALALAGELGTVLAVTGPVDIVTDGQTTIRVHNGHPLMGRVTGTGCTASAMVGAFIAADRHPLCAAATALSVFGICGEMASLKAQSPGSYAIALIDALYDISAEACQNSCRFS